MFYVPRGIHASFICIPLIAGREDATSRRAAAYTFPICLPFPPRERAGERDGGSENICFCRVLARPAAVNVFFASGASVKLYGRYKVFRGNLASVASNCILNFDENFD